MWEVQCGCVMLCICVRLVLKPIPIGVGFNPIAFRLNIKYCEYLYVGVGVWILVWSCLWEVFNKSLGKTLNCVCSAGVCVD